MGWKSFAIGNVGHNPENFFVSLAVGRIGKNDFGVPGPGTALFIPRLHRFQRLGPLAIGASVPEEPGAMGRADDGQGVAGCLFHPLGDRNSIGKASIRLVAGGTGDGAVAAEPFVEK